VNVLIGPVATRMIPIDPVPSGVVPPDGEFGVAEHPSSRSEAAVTEVVVDRIATRKALRIVRCTNDLQTDDGTPDRRRSRQYKARANG
jgi:hypothetical protein